MGNVTYYDDLWIRFIAWTILCKTMVIPSVTQGSILFLFASFAALEAMYLISARMIRG